MDKVIKLKVLTTGVYSTGAADLNNYYTKEEVNILVDKLTSGDIDLTNYYTKAETDRLIPNNYLTVIPDEYITELELNSKGYITEHLDLSEYALKSDIPTDYITEEELDDYVTEELLDAKGYIITLDNYYTKEEVDNKVASSGTFDSTMYYNKSEVNALIPTDYITEIPAEYVTESELNEKGYITEHLDISGLATKDELSGLKSEIPTNYLTSIPEEYITESELQNKGYITDVSSLATKEELSGYLPIGNYLTEVPAEYVTETVVDNKIATLIGNIETILDNIIG